MEGPSHIKSEYKYGKPNKKCKTQVTKIFEETKLLE
jgi:hypothetical protein